MNIFYALSEGRGRLTETNLSAFAAFLLAPNKPHGFSGAFLRAFLTEVAKCCADPERFSAALSHPLLSVEVGLEKKYDKPVSRIVDIEIQLITGDGDSQQTVHHIIIENKVKAGAAQTQQLAEQFACISEANRDLPTPVTVVFLTPPGDAAALRAEFDALKLDVRHPHRKAWLRWTGGPESQRSVSELIRDLLRREAIAEIEPITDYTRHTLKAFVQFLQREIVAESVAKRRFASQDSMDVIEQRLVELDGKDYVIARYRGAGTSGPVKVFDAEADQEVDAHPMLRVANSQYALGIQLHGSGGRMINTQLLGKYVLTELTKRGVGAASGGD
ncbi:MAG TPA: PD-(D/E)XK nuclease family protein [Paraburkholderia sp.]